VGKDVGNASAEWQIGAGLLVIHAHGSDPLQVEVETPTPGRQVLTGSQVSSMKTAAASPSTWATWTAANLGSMPWTERDDLRSTVQGAQAWSSTSAGALTLRHHFGDQGIDDTAAVPSGKWASCSSSAAAGGSTWASWLGTNAASLHNLTSSDEQRLGEAVEALAGF
jgi:hypothetical protein